jgi:XTP/dITP diphosphohydrolase
MLEGFENREAHAVCIAAVFDGREMRMGMGEVKGTIADDVRGENGFGWDVIFIPEGHERTYAEMSSSEKNDISHRRQAFEELKKNL